VQLFLVAERSSNIEIETVILIFRASPAWREGAELAVAGANGAL